VKIFFVSVPLEFPLANYCLAAQIAAVPETSDVQVTILNLDSGRLRDYNRKNTEIWRYIAKVEEEKPDIIAFSVYLWSNLSIRELISITNKVYPGISILVGGPELSSQQAAESWVRGGGVTAAIRGEGEITIVEIVKRLREGEGLAGVQGCSWWNGESVVHECDRPPVKDLSQLASPYLTGWITEDLFDRSTSEKRGAFPRAFLETYRGCYMQCSYCQWGNGTALRFSFPQDRVREELSWILSRRVKMLWIVDAMFGFKKQIAKDLLRHIIDEKRRYGAQTSIVCYHNQDFYDPELFDLYREAEVSVEVDLQSTSKEVLTRVGRAKWYTDSFDRHLEAFRKHKVPTTGGADLIIGLPRDNETTFTDSVNFLLQRGMHINLYQTSIIPSTPMSRSIEEDGIVYSETPPRAVFKNATFPVQEMVRSRLIGHGVDFFKRYPKTAALLWKQKFERPVDFCSHLGQLIWSRYGLMYGESHTHDAVLAEKQDLIAELLPELCPKEWLLPIVTEIFKLETAASKLCYPVTGSAPILRRTDVSLPQNDTWLDVRPRFRSEAVETIRFRYRLDKILNEWGRTNEVPPEDALRNLEREPSIALLFLAGWRSTSHIIINSEVVYQLLLRFSGHFTIAACLDSFTRGWRIQNLAPLRERLTWLAQAGVIELGIPAGTNGNGAGRQESRYQSEITAQG
jgi:radical SAM superfamily enzyme YgiQ (UPF0313 family)